MPDNDNDNANANDAANHDHFTGLKALQARTKIEELKAAYARGADAVFRSPGPASALALADLFTQDGVLDLGPFGRFEGRAALLDAFENILPQGTKWSTHYIVSPVITIVGNEASGSWYYLIKSVPQSPANAPMIDILGGYEDQYRRVGGVWRIRETVTSFFVPPA